MSARSVLAAALLAVVAAAGPGLGAAERPAPLPPVSELVPRVLAVSDDAEEALDTIGELGDTSALEPRIGELAEERSRLASRLDAVLASESPDEGRVAALARRGELLEKRMGDAMATASGRLQRLGEVRADWTARRALWQRWAKSLEADAELAAVYRDELRGPGSGSAR